MCIIIDNDTAHRVFCREDDVNYGVVRQALFETRSRRAVTLVSGGKLHEELCNNHTVEACLTELDRAGRIRILSTEKVEQEVTKLKQSGLLLSNDPHVIAVARLSRARVLCSQDGNLHRDFRNKKLVDQPRGHIFTSATHLHLLRQCASGC